MAHIRGLAVHLEEFFGSCDHHKTPRLVERGFEIAVSDNGPGIPPDKMEAILEPFFTTKSFGTGLGLPACVNIMKNHSGGLDVKSEPGHGATFTAWFPAAQKPAA